MADIFDELVVGNAPPEDLVRALRRQKTVGTIGALSGDRRIAGVGGAEAASALQQAEGLRDSRERKQARADQQAFARWQQQQASEDRKAQRDYQYAALKQARELAAAQMANQYDIAGLRASGAGRGLTPFEKERQRKLGGEAADWETRGQPMAESNRAMLAGALQDLKNDKGLGDEFLPALIPDNIRALYNKKGLDLQNRVDSVSVQNMRDAFGAQFTEKENALFRALSYNPALSNEDNRKRLEAKLQLIDNMMQAKQHAFGRYMNGGTGTEDDALFNEAASILQGGQ